MSLPQSQDLYARSNATFRATFNVSNADTGAALDLTGASAKLQCRQAADPSGSPTIGVGNVASDIQGCWISAPGQGKVQVRIDKSTLAAISLTPPGELELYYDLQITLSTGEIIVPAEGVFHLQWGRTQ